MHLNLENEKLQISPLFFFFCFFFFHHKKLLGKETSSFAFLLPLCIAKTENNSRNGFHCK